MRTSVIVAVATCCLHAQQGNKGGFRPEIPKTWDDAAIPTLEIPLANPAASPKHVSADYYYKIPVRPIYKSYAVLPRAASVQAIWSGYYIKNPLFCGTTKATLRL